MTAAAILQELQRRGIELQVVGDRLRYRPKSAVTPELAASLTAEKPRIIEMLTQRAAPTYTPNELTLIAECRDPEKMRRSLDAIKSRFGGEIIHVLGPAPDDLPSEWRSVFEERAGIMQYDGGLSRPDAERAAMADVRRQIAECGALAIDSESGEPLYRGKQEFVDANWYNGPVDRESLQLASYRDGWSPVAWRLHLLEMAEACESVCPDRAATFRESAQLMREAAYGGSDE